MENPRVCLKSEILGVKFSRETCIQNMTCPSDCAAEPGEMWLYHGLLPLPSARRGERNHVPAQGVSDILERKERERERL